MVPGLFTYFTSKLMDIKIKAYFSSMHIKSARRWICVFFAVDQVNSAIVVCWWLARLVVEQISRKMSIRDSF